MITKQDYDALIARYSKLEREMVRLQERKRQAEAELKKVNDEIYSLTKGGSADLLLEKLEKELEVRTELICTRVSEFETILQDLKIGDSDEGKD